MSTVSSLARFHLAGGARVASRNAIATIGLIIIVLGSAPDPLVWLRFLALGAAGSHFTTGPLVGLAAIALGLARDAVPRLTLGLGGWTRSLPATGVQHRRGVVYGLPIIQLPLVAAMGVAAALTVFAYRVPVSLPKLLGLPAMLIAAGAAATPARRGLLAGPCFVATTLLAALGRWDALGAAIALFVVADIVAGPLVFRARRATAAPVMTPRGLRMFRFTWRAMGWRMLTPLPLPALALAAAWFYSRNNGLTGADLGFVARLWTIIALALYVGAIADIVVTRRPAWPWSRSLPWSSTDRAIDDAIALGLPAVIIAVVAVVVDPRALVVALATLPPIAALAALLLHGARQRLTRVSGPLILAGIFLGTIVAFVPLVAALAAAATPFIVRVAARRERRAVVTGWKELHHDASGDSLAWSAQ